MTPSEIRDISEKVYRRRLEDSCKGDVERMIAKDKDEGQKLRGRAVMYDGPTRAYLDALRAQDLVAALTQAADTLALLGGYDDQAHQYRVLLASVPVPLPVPASE